MPHRLKQPEKAYSKQYVLGLGYHGFHRINYLEWGKPEHFNKQETLLCVHGLTRNARDFDYFAQKLCNQYRIVCPDVVGRGDSDHLLDDESYNYLQYNADMNVLINRIGDKDLNWIGTSMGGIIGMVLASVSQSPIKRLVVNDIGPEVSRDALLSIAKYIGKSTEFETYAEVENYLREIYPEFAPMTDEDWAQMAKYSCKKTEQGTLKMKVDPRIGDAFRDSISYFNVDMWDIWEKITCPVLVLRGKESTFLSEETAQRMLSCGPKTSVYEFDNTGHTPTLRNDEQVSVIADWLNDT